MLCHTMVGPTQQDLCIEQRGLAHACTTHVCSSFGRAGPLDLTPAGDHAARCVHGILCSLPPLLVSAEPGQMHHIDGCGHAIHAQAHLQEHIWEV